MNTSQDAAVRAFQKLAELARHRSSLFWLFARGFSNPTSEFVEMLQSGALLEDLQRALGALALGESQYGSALRGLTETVTAAAGADARQLLSQMRVEYMRLFIGPQHPPVPIYETLHQEQPTSAGKPLLFVSSTAVDVEKQYREAGLRLANQDSPDHLTTELEFLVYLCEQESEAWAAGNNTMAKKWRRLEQKFLDEHLGKWAPGLCREVEKQSEEAFYRYFAAIAETVLHMEVGAFRIQ